MKTNSGRNASPRYSSKLLIITIATSVAPGKKALYSRRMVEFRFMLLIEH